MLVLSELVGLLRNSFTLLCPLFCHEGTQVGNTCVRKFEENRCLLRSSTIASINFAILRCALRSR